MSIAAAHDPHDSPIDPAQATPRAAELVRAVIGAVQLTQVDDVEFESSLTELQDLARTLGYVIVGRFTQKRNSFDTAAYLGSGKREEIAEFVTARAGFEDVDILLVDHEISPSQARNLEKAVGCEVMDRTMVILEIFHRHARSRAARAQVEIARLAYMAPRLRELAKLAGPQGRQRSGVGGRGSGESSTELDRRKIRDRIAELQDDITAMDSERAIQRARRQERQEGLARVALVGYTNAGKSTLMRALTGSEVLVANQLFATLDTTVRTLHPECVPRVLVSDTVGFIKNLPHGLVASFKSTLDEALDAELLLHVIDASDPGYERQRQVTEAVLHEIGADTVPRLRVYNKIDRVGEGSVDANGHIDSEGAIAAQDERASLLRVGDPNCIILSARRPDDIARLHQTIVDFFQKDMDEAEFFVPWDAQEFRGVLFSQCEVLGETADDEGAHFHVRAPATVLTRIREKLYGKPTEEPLW
jgi:GTPase